MKVYSKSERPKLWLATVPVQCSLVRVGWRFSCEGKGVALRRSWLPCSTAVIEYTTLAHLVESAC